MNTEQKIEEILHLANNGKLVGIIVEVGFESDYSQFALHYNQQDGRYHLLHQKFAGEKVNPHLHVVSEEVLNHQTIIERLQNFDRENSQISTIIVGYH